MANLFSDVTNFINKELGLDTQSTSQSSDGGAGFLPWDPEDRSVFWNMIELDPIRWNKLYPYRLLVVDVTTSPPSVHGIGVNKSLKKQGMVTKASSTKAEQGLEYIVTQVARGGAWECVLPITPQQLKITDQFAINTSATMRGVVEEHNGVKFKTISVSGTTGIWPRKPTIGGRIAQPSIIGSIFGGTLESAQSLTKGINALSNTITKTAESFTGKKKTAENPKPESNNFDTGYYQCLFMAQFFEQYAELKKNPKNKNLRLVFDIPKQNQSFIVTPVMFEMAQSEQKPNQMMFSFQLKAWKRINLEEDSQPSGGELPSLDANAFQNIVKTIAETRRVLSGATNLIKAVRSDFQKPFNVLRQTALAIKDLGGLTMTAADLPRQLEKDFKSSIESALVDSNAGISAITKTANTAFGIQPHDPLAMKGTSSSQKAGEVVSSISLKQRINEGLSSDEVASGALGADAAARLETDPLNNVFENPEENFDLFDSVSIDDLTLQPAQRLAIEDELLRIRLLTINDFRSFKQEMVDLAHDIADNFGAGNETYSYIYGLPDPKSRPIDMTVEENEVLQAIFESIQVFDTLTSTKQFDDFKIQNPMDFVGGLANESGIDFQQFSSKMLVPVPFGLTIEEIAARYMGDVSKWLEIVTLNKLRSPYIDEVGFTYEMLSNAEGRQFNVDDTEDNLFIGQKITIVSDIQPQITRKIINVEKIGDNNFLVTVDGLDDLDVFQTSANARIKGYLPGTINSQNQIYLPVDFASNPDDRTFEIANVPDTALNKLAKVDFLLTDNFDIAINSVGDLRLASGLTNLIQALKLKIRTQKGTLLRHLDYGVGLEHGVSIADIENGEIIGSLNAMIEGDGRFQSIDRLSIRLNGSTMSIDMSVRIANGTGVLPISFDIRPV